MGFKSGHLNPAKVIREIEALEGLGEPSLLKPPILNKHPPLKGLWHKHYLEDGVGAMAFNLRKGLGKYGLPLFSQYIREATTTGEERFLNAEDCNAIVNDAVLGNWSRLVDAAELTGEWIVYARHEGLNYYLCMGTHDKDEHETLRTQIDTLCCQEFPFLATLLANA